MTADEPESRPVARDRGHAVAAVLGLVLVLVGIVNAMPAIPGLDAWIAAMAGSADVVIRRFPYQYLYPLVFLLMMTIVALRHSLWRDARRAQKGRSVTLMALIADLMLVGTTLLVVFTYLIEIPSVCLIDQFSGERAQLIADTLRAEQDLAKAYGLPVPESVDDPQCVRTLGVWLFAVVALAMLVFLGYNVRVWGLPLVMVAIAVALYTNATVLVWYFNGTEDISKYLVTKLGGEPRQLIDGRPNVLDILINNSQGLLGRFMDVLLNTVFPYLILGNLFGASAGGKALIKLAFHWTRRLRGGPAHAAIVSSAMFGTISGGPVVNVMSTGVLTIPMMIKRGFSRTFAGGVEAAASSGGSIMPPVMGVAAFVLAALTAVPYREVIVAALIPALAYYGCLFLTVVFQARKQGIEAIGELADEYRLTRTDAMHLVMIFAPIGLILLLLLTPKEAIGCGAIAGWLGVERVIEAGACRAQDLPFVFKLVQNSVGDASAAGWWSMLLLAGLLFLDADMRAKPRRLVEALAQSGMMISTLYLMFLAVSIIDFCLNFTGLSGYVTLDVLGWLRSFDAQLATSGFFLLLALLVAMGLAVLLGMGMPAVPAYINVALVMGPVLSGLGIANFTAHMFVFYFAIASAITPPVAIAAFAAASISGSDPIATGFSAVRAGLVMFLIPFVFAFHPELLLIDAALIDPASGPGQVRYLAGHDGQVHWAVLAWLLARLAFAVYLATSAVSRFDLRALRWWDVLSRLGSALAMLSDAIPIQLGGIALGALLVGAQYFPGRRSPARRIDSPRASAIRIQE
ncbi:MAG: TRAP transporter fused permease subunit [Lautropia sp.]